MTVVFDVPQVFIDAYHHMGAWLTIFALIAVAGLLGSLVVEVRKHHYNKKQLENLSKKAVAWWLTFSTAAFTYVGALLFFVHNHLDFLQALPYVGKYTLPAVGFVTLLYNVRLNKTYKTASNYLSKWAKKPEAPQPTNQPPTTDPGNPDALA